MSTPLSFYEERLRLHQAELARVARLSRLVPIGRLSTFIVAAACGVAYLLNHDPLTLPPAVALLVAFVGFGIWDVRITQREDRVRAAILFCERGACRARGELDKLPPRGVKLREAAHPYAHDLDLYGKGSLLALLDAMETEPSERMLAAWLGEAAPPDEVAARQQAARELGEAATFREGLFVHARPLSEGDPLLPQFFTWCREQGGSSGKLALLMALGVALPAVTLTLLFAGERLGLPRSAWLLPAAVQWAISMRVGGQSALGLVAASRGAKAFGPFGEIIDAVGAAGFRAARLASISQRLHGGPGAAGPALRRLDAISSWAEARESGLFRVLIGPLVMYDVHLLLALERWRARNGAGVEGWAAAMDELLALGGLGTYAFDNPGFAFPDVEPGPSRFEAEGLVHPLIPSGIRVANDVRLDGPGTALLITGSNMSGKSTLLRAMGLATVMAQAGAPTPARAFRSSPLLVRSSIRVSDSLSAGVSHFYAELLALKRVVADCERGPVFFLLDEILHGTNSLERHAGAKAVIRHLLERGAMGCVTTHDLGLSELVDELPGKVRPVHLLEQAEGDKMTFDYKLREGVLRSGNALRLMRQLGLPVGAPPEAPGPIS
jgi:hypothetical protein